MRHLLRSVLLLTTAAFMLAACEETKDTDEYADWQARNEAFIDSIARVANANADGRWTKFLSFKLNDKDIDGKATTWENDRYVYCHIESNGSGTQSPLFTDSVLVNYRGRLIPTTEHPYGYVFDQSYQGEINPATNVPGKFCTGGVVEGFSTALMHMHDGDIWHIYIPYDLGYGTTKKSDIPAYSTLIFELNLVSHTPVGTVVVR
ncbi:MAG: FKBP-type peptidyl-prolyl cis-trans isomerase [Bacteroidaceae bacterium]|nr:FKBP-type peptidyl-prolyl cis-trans isomerase [Bacteroidaceae bacterium]